MPAAHSIDPIKAAQADALSDAGYGSMAISRIVGLKAPSVSNILNRVGHWGETANTAVFIRHRREQSLALEAAGRQLAAQAMIQCADTLDKANAYQACLISSIMIDKTRLLAGESTENVSVQVNATISIDNLSARLARRLIESNTDKSNP